MLNSIAIRKHTDCLPSLFLRLFFKPKTIRKKATDKKFIFYAERSSQKKKKDSSKVAAFKNDLFSSPRTEALTIISLAYTVEGAKEQKPNERGGGDQMQREHLRNEK
jgi:hypothetical protein